MEPGCGTAELTSLEEVTTSDRLADVMAAQAAVRGGQTWLADARSERIVTYAGLADAAAVWAEHLAATAVAPDARVLLQIGDPLRFAVVHLAVVASGRCSVPVDPDAPPGELARVRAATNPALVLTDDDVEVTGMPVSAARTQAPPTGRAGCVWLQTSGSTGEPKIVELDETRLLHVARAVAAHNRLTPSDRGFNALPLFHVNAQVVGLLATLVSGGTLVLDRRFHRAGFWPLLAQQRISWLNAVPAVLGIVAAEPLPDPLPELRFVRSASAALPPVVRDGIERTLGVPVVESYGMTEAASQLTATPLDEPAPVGSAGRAVGCEVAVRADDGSWAAPDSVGRIQVRGAGVIRRYVGDRAADRFDRDGWLDTGDLGRLDDGGWLYLLDRADDVINRGGELVYPREVEEVLLTDARVQAAVVVGRPHDILGHVPVAYIQPVDTAFDPAAGIELVEALQARCRSELSRFKRPADFELVTRFPRAATGKIRRHQVRAEALA